MPKLHANLTVMLNEGEINFPNLSRAIDATGYADWIGCEFIPAGTTE